MQIPSLDQQLIDALSEQFPDSVPSINDSDREVWCKVGEQRVIRFLKRIFEEQNENILNQKVT